MIQGMASCQSLTTATGGAGAAGAPAMIGAEKTGGGLGGVAWGEAPRVWTTPRAVSASARPIASALAGAGFAVEALGEGYTPQTPRFAGWMEWGVARKL